MTKKNIDINKLLICKVSKFNLRYVYGNILELILKYEYPVEIGKEDKRKELF